MQFSWKIWKFLSLATPTQIILLAAAQPHIVGFGDTLKPQFNGMNSMWFLSAKVGAATTTEVCVPYFPLLVPSVGLDYCQISICMNKELTHTHTRTHTDSHKIMCCYVSCDRVRFIWMENISLIKYKILKDNIA